MANNRFTDPKKWDDDWYLGLPPKMKCAWAYICDNCESAGLLRLSFSLISFRIGDTVTKKDFETHFGDRIVWISNDKIWIVGFIGFQYKTLSTKNAAHRNIMARILSIVDGLPMTDPQLTLINGWKEALGSLKEEDEEEDELNSEKGSGEKPIGEVLFDFWNSNCWPLSKAEKFTDKRKAQAKAQATKYLDPLHWEQVLSRWKKSDFCISQWKPTFDDFLNENKRIATLEGKYDNREQSTGKRPDAWITKAERVASAIKSWGHWSGGDQQAVIKFLGNELYDMAVKAGVYKIRQLPANDFYHKSIAGMLKAASEGAA